MRAEVDRRPDRFPAIRGEAGLGERNGEATLTPIVGRVDEPLPDRREAGRLHRRFECQVECRDGSAGLPGQRREQLAPTKVLTRPAEQQNLVSRLLEPLSRDVTSLLDQAEHANHRGRIDAAPLCLVVEADIPARYRRAERPTRFRHPVDRLAERPHDLGPFRAGKVEAIGHCEGLCAAADDVASRFDDGEPGPGARVEPTVAPIGVE